MCDRSTRKKTFSTKPTERQNNETQTAETEARCPLDVDLDRLRSNRPLLIRNNPPSNRATREQTVSDATSNPQARKAASPPSPYFSHPIESAGEMCR
jgi:hypothetical protein